MYRQLPTLHPSNTASLSAGLSCVTPALFLSPFLEYYPAIIIFPVLWDQKEIPGLVREDEQQATPLLTLLLRDSREQINPSPLFKNVYP